MADRIKLLVLTHNFPRFQGDFAGVFIALLARRLAEYGIDPVVLAPHDANLAEYEVMDGLPVYRFRYARTDQEETIAYRGHMHQLVLGSITGMFKFKAFLDAFRRATFDVIAKERVQVVSGNWLVPSGIVMKTLAAKTNLPLILSSHGTDIRLLAKYEMLTRRYFGSLMRRLERWTVVSSFLRDEIIKIEPAAAPLLEVLPVPHDETVFYKDESISRDPNLIVSVTRFTDQKRVDYMVGAFATVSEKYPQARLELYGTGPLQADIEALVARLGLKDRVTLFQPVPQQQLRAVYNRAAISVLNSFREGFGLALSEAMLCGACAVGTRSGGITDIIAHNETGMLVDLDDTAQLADTLMELLKNPAKRAQLAEAGHRFALNTYASGPLAARFADIIKAAIDSPGGSHSSR